MCVYTYIYIVIPEASGPQQLKLIRFQIYRDIPVTRPQYCLLRIHCMPLFIYIYLFQYIHKKFIVSTTYHDIPCSNSYMLYQSRYSICLYKYIYIYIPLVYDLFITSVPLFIPLAFMYLYIYIFTVGWSLAYHLFISTYVYTILHCIPNIPLYIHQYITLAYHWLIQCIPKKKNI